MTDWDDRDFRSADENGEPEPHETTPPPDEDSSSTSSSSPSSSMSWPLFVAAALALVAGLGLYWLFSARGVSVPPTRSSASSEEALAEVAPEPAQPSEIEPEEPDVDLPGLSASDVFVRELLAGLSRHPAMTSLLVSDELVRKIVTAIVNVAEGDHPARALSVSLA